MTRVKVCGLTRAEDIEVAVEAGAHALGFVFEPTSPRTVADRPEVLAMATSLPPLIQSVAVFAHAFAHPFLARFGAVQAFDPPEARCRIMAVRLTPGLRIEDVLARQFDAEAVLLDAYAADGYGGTGKRVDLGFAAELRQELTVPLILAGGLSPESVAEAVRVVRPYGVDASSGLESAPGIKDAERVRAYVAEALSA